MTKNSSGSFNTLLPIPGEPSLWHYSLPAFEKNAQVPIRKLPVCMRILLESLLRNSDGKSITEADILRLARWNPKVKEESEVPFIVSRVLLQDFTGVPLLVDLAAMRDAVAAQGFDPKMIEPKVPVDLVIDHSVQVDQARTSDSYSYNLDLEFERNKERYIFLKWGQEAFKTFKVVPPGIGICHQVNLEHIAPLVAEKKIDQGTLLFSDTLVGTDSHTTMINGLGVMGWGVGGIEAEASMLGQPLFIEMPEVIGFHLSGALMPGVTATDLTLYITEILRKEKVVGKFVEFFGEGTASLSIADRATIGNMAPEYGATMGFFPSDEKTLDYLRMTGRSEEKIAKIKKYLVAQGLFGIPKRGEVDYTRVLELDLSAVLPSVAGPKRPQDRISLSTVKERFRSLLTIPVVDGGYGKNQKEAKQKIGFHTEGVFNPDLHHLTGGTTSIRGPGDGWIQWSESEMLTNRPYTEAKEDASYPVGLACDAVLAHGSVVIAAITSCTNTSNPSVMLAAGLLAKKAVEKGLSVNPIIKTSLAPGSRVVTDYLEKAGLQSYLDKLGFNLVAYGCTTCIGNSGPLDETLEETIRKHDLISASVLSGNRNFEARIHSSVKANFLMSPPLVVAFALAGRVDIDMEKEPLGHNSKGEPVFLRDIWPSMEEINEAIQASLDPSMFRKRYANVLEDNPLWGTINTSTGVNYKWDKKSTYIQNPPYLDGFSLQLPSLPSLENMRPLALFGDSITTDHISPAGSIRPESPAGKYLIEQGVTKEDFNSYGSRRGNDRIMTRGTFANVRIRNLIADGKEGGFTKLMPEGNITTIYEACQTYKERNIPLIVFAGKDYGMGSSRDWAAKGSALLGVKAVVARSFERIHRSNLIGMGILPLQFREGDSWESLGIKGDELFTLKIKGSLKPRQEATLEITKDGQKREVPLLIRIDTPIEVNYYQHGGILPFVLRQILSCKQDHSAKSCCE